MWIISEKYGAFNTDNICAIQPPHPESDFALVFAYNAGKGFRITEGHDNYQKILTAIADEKDFVLSLIHI